jgi:hypothetical protein
MTKVLNSLFITGTGSDSQALGVTSGYTYIYKNLSIGEPIYSQSDNLYIKNDSDKYGIRVSTDGGNIFLISGSQTTYFNDFQTSSNIDSVVIGGTDSQSSFGTLKIGTSDHLIRIISATSHSAIVSKGIIGFGETFSNDYNLYPLTFEGDLNNERTRFLFNLDELSFGTQSNPYLFNISANGDISIGTNSTLGKLFIHSSLTQSENILFLQSGDVIGETFSNSYRFTSDGNLIISNYNPQSKIEITSTYSGNYSDLVLITSNQDVSSFTLSQNAIIGLTNGIQISPRTNSIKLDPNVKINSTIDDSIYLDFGFITQSNEEILGIFTQSSNTSKVLINPTAVVSTSSNTQFGLNLTTNLVSIGETQTISSLRINSNITSTYSGSYAADLDIYSNGNPSLIVFNSGNISVGTTSNSAKLFISGDTYSFRLNDGNQGSGKFLISDSNGYGNWTTFSAIGNATAFGTPSFVALFEGVSTLTASVIYQGVSGSILIGYTNSSPNYKFDSNTLRVKGDVFFDNFTFPLSSRVFQINGSYLFDEVNGNLALGYTALGGNNNSGTYNIGIGHKALLNYTSTSEGNVAIGYESLKDSTSKYNIGIGYHTLWKNTAATQSIGIGWKALENGMTFSFNNVAIGFESLKDTLSPTNIGIGNNTLRSNLTGSQSIAIGYNSLSSGNPDNNIGIGVNSLRTSSTPDNIAIGNNALSSLTIGSNSIAIGNSSLLSATAADNNIAIGNFSQRSNTLGNRNISIGLDSQRVGTSSSDNLSIGWNSLYNNRNPLGQNVAIGNYALYNQTIGYYNVGIGYGALYTNTNGFGNVAVGYNALGAGSNSFNVAIGFQAAAYNDGGVYNLALGYNSLFNNATGSFNTSIGGQSMNSLKFGSRNIGIGYGSIAGLTSGNDNIGIGFNVQNFGIRSDKNLIISGSAGIGLNFNGLYNISNNTFLGINILPASQSNNNTIIGGNQDLRTYLVNTASSILAIPNAFGVSPGDQGGAVGNPLTGMVMISSGDGKRHFVSENDSVSIGVDAGLNDTWQLGKNIAIGRESMLNMNSVWRNLTSTASLGGNNIAIGYRALQLSTASRFNIAIGDFALQNQRFSGSANPEEYNVAIGYGALQQNTTGRQNVVIGHSANNAGNSSTTLGNVAIGYAALQFNNPVATSQNTAIGYQALNQNRTGIQNFAIGYNSSFGGTQGSFNVTIGNSSNMYSNGSSNIFIGHESGNPVGNIATGSDSTNFLSNYNQNIGIGQWTHRYMGFYDSRWAGITPSSNNLAIGYRAFEGTTGSFWFGLTYTVSSSYNVAIGNFALQNNQGTTYSTIGWSKGDGVLTSYASFGERTRAKGFNTSIGYAAMQNNVTGFRNTAIGGEALSFGSHSTNNVAIGFRAGYNLGSIRNFDLNNLFGSVANNTSQANFNVAIGNFTLHTATMASRTIAIGHSALERYSGQDGHNVGIGWRSLQNLTTGINNTALGSNAGNGVQTTNGNVAIGLNTLNAGNPGSNNVAIGVQSQASNLSGANNITIGGNSGYFLRGSNNVSMGYESLFQSLSGSWNVAIGGYALGNATNSSFNVAIGGESQYYMGIPQLAVVAGTDTVDWATTSTVNFRRPPNENLSIGYKSMAMYSVVTASNIMPGLTQIHYPAFQVGVGNYTLQFNQGSQSTAVGYQAMANALNSSANVAIGYQAMQLGSYSINNVAIGWRAGYNLGSAPSRLSGTNSTGYAFNNIAIGGESQYYMGIPQLAVVAGTDTVDWATTSTVNFRRPPNENLSIGYRSMQMYSSVTASAIMPGLTQIHYPSFQVGVGNYTLQFNQGSQSVAVGYEAMSNALNSSANVAVGYQAMQLGSYSINNVAIGWRAGYNLGSAPSRLSGTNSTGYAFNNIAIGTSALQASTYSEDTIAIGTSALLRNTVGIRNIAIGSGALQENTIGIDNIAIGYQALRNNVDNTSNSNASFNVGIGRAALIANTTGYRNIAIGYFALSINRIGDNNLALGHNTMLLATGSYNVGVGAESLKSLGKGTRNTAIGFMAGASAGGAISSSISPDWTDTDNTYIGAISGAGLASGSFNTLIGGNIGIGVPVGMTFGSNNTYIGFGITTSANSNFNNTVIGARVNLPPGITNSIIIANGSGQQRINVNSQGYFGVGTQSPSAMLTVNKQTGDTNTTLVNFTSDSQGILLPRLTTAQILAISSPADGLTVYNTDQETLNFYRGTTATWSRVTYTSI